VLPPLFILASRLRP